MTSPRRIVLSPRAEDDLRDIRDYLVEHASREIAIAQLRRIEAVSSALVQHPFRGRPRPRIAPDLRSVLAKPYVIFYRVDEDIEIIRVLHGMRDIAAAFTNSDEDR